MEVKSAKKKKTRSIESHSGSKPRKLVAYCSQEMNIITLVDRVTREIYSSFPGPTLQTFRSNGNSDVLCTESDLILLDCWTHVKEIPSTQLLCSLQHNPN